MLSPRRVGLAAIGCASLVVLLTTASSTTSANASSLQGRWKIQGNQCLFDPDDGGPDQCAWYNPGRFKGGDGEEDCYYAPEEWGFDQCEP